jgi:hypothetical protein
MWNERKVLFVSSLAALMLLGIGCGPRYPSEAELSQMTDAQKEQNMQEMMKQYPAKELSSAQKEAEAQKMRDAVKTGTILHVGEFEPVVHDAQGSARIVKMGDRYVLALSEDFAVDAGPFLVVMLSGHPNPSNSAELHARGALEVGKLKATSGGQMYELPAGTDVSQFASAVIYCKPFSVVFGLATFK